MSISFYESTALRTEVDDGKLLHEIVYIISQAEDPYFYGESGWSDDAASALPMINDGKLMDRFPVGQPVFLITQEAFNAFFLSGR